jgi:UDP-N-acetylglucosamine 3-dehydrogenase
LRVGILGLGVMGKNHARVLSGMDSVTEVILFDPILGKQGDIMGKAVEAELDKFLDQEFDYCVVSAPTSAHLDLALELVKREIPALVEKPIAPSVGEGEKILKAFSEAGLIGAVGHVERYNPASIALKQKLGEGLLGNIFQVSTRRVGPYTGRIRDVGVIKDLASHDIHLVSWLTGQPYASITAKTASVSDGPHEDSVIAVGALGDGTLVSHVVNWISPTKERVTTVLGEKGLLIADTLSGSLSFHENGTNQSNWDSFSQFKGISEGPVHKFELIRVEPLVSEHLAFQNAILSGDADGVVTFDEALEVLKVAELMIASGKR